MDNILEVSHISKSFKDRTIIKDLNFTVKEGDFFSILGPSGCGKTTLLRMIAGFLEPTNGKVFIRGKDMTGIPPNKRPVNIVFQSLALFPMMNVKENIAFGLRRRKFKKQEINDKVSSMLERVGLEGYEKKSVTQLSGGQRQRVAIARSLVLEPSILLLDEPLGALDRKLREHMKIELKLLQAEIGTTFIYITHDQSEALVMSNQVAVMNNGNFDQLDIPKNLYKSPSTSFVAGFVGETNKFNITTEVIDDNEITIKTKNGWKLNKQCNNTENYKYLFIRPESVILKPEKELRDISRFTIKVKTILFDGSDTKISALVENTKEIMLISLPQNAQFEDVVVGDEIEAAVHHDDLKCYKE